MKQYGLIGFPLTHSFSARYFTEKFSREGISGCVYLNFPMEQIGLLPRLIADHPRLAGLNVTIPFKRQVIAYLDQLDDEAASVGAVNTVTIARKGGSLQLKGFNTDIYGFRESLRPYLKPRHHKAMILGTGGAAVAVAHVLKGMGFEIQFASRNPRDQQQLSYEQLTPESIAGTQLIVNTSPLGMHPDTGACPAIPYQAITPDHVLFDLIYNPAETRFLARGKERGATIINGLQMLHLQAEESWKIWNTKD
jgi:shikimate dehydrogenase